MGLNLERAGHTYPSYRYEISRAKIREFASSLGESDPRYFSDGEDCLAPTTFPACFTLAQLMTTLLEDPDLRAHASLLHGSQTFEFGERPLRPGDVMACTPRITNLTRRMGSDFLTLETECTFEDSGALAVRSISMVVFADQEARE